MTEEKNNKILVKGYGDMLAKLRQQKLIVEISAGTYQGTYLVATLDEDFHDGLRIFIYKDSYGSCSGCDWLKSAGDYDYSGEGYLVDVKEANEYCVQSIPFYILPFKQGMVDILIELSSKEWGEDFTAEILNDFIIDVNNFIKNKTT